MKSILLVVTSPKEDRSVTPQSWQDFRESTEDYIDKSPTMNRIGANSWLFALDNHLSIFSAISFLAQHYGVPQRSLIVDTESSWLVSRPEVISED